MSALLAGLMLALLQVSPNPPVGVPTRLGQELLRECDVVAVARAESVLTAGKGVVLVRFVVIDRIHGLVERDGEVSVIAFAGHFAVDATELLFLRRYGRGGRYEVLYRVDGKNRLFGPKLAATRRTAQLAALSDPQRRARSVVAWLAEGIEADDAWMPRYALDELQYMLARQPWVFRPEDAARLERAAAVARDPEVSVGVKNVASTIADRGERLSGPQD